MNLLIIVFFVIWNIRLFANLLSYINLWFVKEYRFDRMYIHLQTKQGKLLYFLPFKRPPISIKTILLFGVGVIGVLSFLGLLNNIRINILLDLLIIDILLFPYISLWVWLFSIPTFLYHKYIIQKAIKKLNNHKKMIVIGVTGSYGKTSVKEFLFTILSEKYSVLKTEASKNSLIGISETILKNLEPHHEVFIVEMGAYKLNEIASIVKVVKPEIGIITAINAQHQDLFKSIETTMMAKFELIEGLIGNSIAIFNADNSYTLKMAKDAHDIRKKVWLYSMNSIKIPEWGDKLLLAQNIEASMSGIKFNLISENKKIRIQTSVLGKHQVSNILAGILVGLFLNIKIEKIVKAIEKLKTYPKTMQKLIGINNSIFINDAFNNNPDAAKAAILYLSMNKGKKILVFQPMIELGKYADKSHEDVGKMAGKYCDKVFLTNANFSKSFISGVKSVTNLPKVSILTAQKIADQIKISVKSGDMVLFKGKESENVFKALVN